MTRNTGEKMVDGLELQATVEPVEPRRALNIHGSAHLALRERFGGAKIGGGHSPVGEGDLDVENHSDEVRDQDKANANWPCGECHPDKEVAEEIPVAAHENKLDVTCPPGCT